MAKDRLLDTLEIVHQHGSFNATAVETVVTCPAGKRPLSAGGSTSQVNLFFITDIIIGSASASVRWETDNGAVMSGATEAWALCAPA